MNIKKTTEGYPCCDHCEKSFRDGTPTISVIEAATARDIFFHKNQTDTINIQNPTKVKLFHRECFLAACGEEWWE